jgi:hypothetical protein
VKIKNATPGFPLCAELNDVDIGLRIVRQVHFAEFLSKIIFMLPTKWNVPKKDIVLKIIYPDSNQPIDQENIPRPCKNPPLVHRGHGT